MIYAMNVSMSSRRITVLDVMKKTFVRCVKDMDGGDYGENEEWIDVRNFNTTCDISDGLVYHIHSYWNDAETSSTTTCGDTGGHYDPYFACGKASQSASTDCVSLGRTLSQVSRICNII